MVFFAAKNICGLRSYVDIPWMWSDQFDLNLQLTGYVTIMTT
ncbi:hypothetical protein CM15mP35_03150 [bacterium]|nr:MAG: hypothetical protein CM15mP35_03150 [bacterium]